MTSSRTVNINKSTLYNPTININQQGGSSSESSLKEVKLEGVTYCLSKTEVIGREEEANKLLELVQTHRRVVISGMGGIGKTSLAAHCARTWSPAFISNAIFIDAETNETVKSGFNSLGLTLDIQNFEKLEQRVQVDAIYETFKDTATLFIFDNVTSFSIINNYLPPNETEQYRTEKGVNFYVIITAQLREFGKTEVYDMPLMSKQSSLELMKVKSENYWRRINQEKEEIDTLIKKMQRHPLAIIQAVAYILDQLMYEDSKYTVQKYLDEFEVSFNDIEFSDYWEDVYRYKSVYTALVMNMNMVKKDKKFGDKAEIALHCMACLRPNSIEKAMFLYLCDSKDKIFNAVIRLLRKYSLIDIESRLGDEYIYIHRLIQHTSQCVLNMQEQVETRNLVLRNTLKLIINSSKFLIYQQFIEGSHINNFVLCDFNKCYSEVYSSGRCGDRLTKALHSVNCEFSAVEGWTAAHYAAYEGSRYMLKLLKERGQSFNVVSQQNWTVLHAYCLRISVANTDICYILGLEKSNLDVQTRDLNTALHISLMKEVCNYDSSKGVYSCYQCQCASQLIASGCDITLTNKDGDTAAHLAARYRHVEVLERLLESPGVDIAQKNNEGHSVNILAEESHVVIYRHTSQPPADVRVWYRCFALNLLENLEAGEKLLKGLLKDREDVPDGVYQDIVQLLDNFPLVLSLAAGYMRHRNIPLNTFKQYLTALPADTVPSSVKESYFGYHSYLYMLFCDVLNNLIKEHKCAFELLSYKSYTDRGSDINASALFALTDQRHSMDDIHANIAILDMLSLWGNTPRFRPHEILKSVTITYSQMRGEEMAVCKAIITSDNWYLCRNAKAPVVRALGVNGVRGAYMGRYGSAPAVVQTDIDGHTDGERVLDVGDLVRWSALHWAAYRDEYFLARELFQLGDPIDTPADVTPLHIAALCGSPSQIELLWEHGAGVNASTAGDGLTPLHLAACVNDTRNIKKLLSRGADVNVTDSEGSTPAHMAALCGRTYNLEILREEGAVMDRPNRAGVTPQTLLDFRQSLSDNR